MTRFWAQNHPVLAALRARRANPGRYGERPDSYRIGLAVEGGGIRGVVSAAMLCALEDLGLSADVFDGIYGNSSGSINCAYFIAGNTWYALSIYYDDLTTRDFVDFRRVFTGNILNLDHAFDKVMELVKPLNYQAVLSSSVPLHVALTDVEAKNTFVVSDFTSKEDLKSALKGGSWLPVAVRGAAEFRGQRVVDGGVLTPHPYPLALVDGCTHVLSLSTGPLRPPRKRHGVLNLLGYHYLERLQPGLGKDYLTEIQRYRKARVRLRQRMLEPGNAPYVLNLAPMPWMPEVKRHELDAGRIIAGARQAYEVMFCAVEQIDPAKLRTNEVRAIPRLTVVQKPRVSVS